MLKINKFTRLFSRGVSSGAEYVEDIVRSLDTEITPLQVHITLHSDLVLLSSYISRDVARVAGEILML